MLIIKDTKIRTPQILLNKYRPPKKRKKNDNINTTAKVAKKSFILTPPLVLFFLISSIINTGYNMKNVLGRKQSDPICPGFVGTFYTPRLF